MSNFLDAIKAKLSEFMVGRNGNKEKAVRKTDPSKVYLSCEKCGQPLSVPKGKGTLKVTCPKCRYQMTTHS